MEKVIDNKRMQHEQGMPEREKQKWRKLIIDLIRSKDIKEYIEKIGYEFSDLDMAKLIAQRIHSLTSQNEKLKELENVTSDQKLKEKIHKKIEKDNQCILELQTPAADEIFLMEIPYEDEEGEYREYFFEFNHALACALESGSDFYIRKIKIHRGSVKWDKDELDDGVIGYLNYRNGEVYSYWCPKDTKADFEYEKYDEEYDFQCCEVEIPHQFKQPDIIRVSSTGDYGIVMFNYERDIREIEGIGKVCLSDSITVELVDDEDMLFNHAHINPDELEYANLSEDHPLKGVLEAAGYVVGGRGYIQALQMECEQYLSRMKKK